MQKCIVGPETSRMLELGHPWVLADRYTKKWPQGNVGDLIALSNQKGDFLATALYDPDDRIVARVLDKNKIQLNAKWLEKRMQQAVDLRRQALLEETDSYRLINSEGDGLPGLTLDRYGDYLMLQLYCRAWETHLELLKKVMQSVYQPQGIYRKFRPQETRALEAKSPSKEYSRLIAGRAATVPLRVKENGLTFLVDLRAGLNTGLLLISVEIGVKSWLGSRESVC